MSLEEPDGVRSMPEGGNEVQTITDPRTMRALTHPVRISIIEALAVGGAMTATQVGEQIGESPTTCSFHLRQLAKYGFAEEAGGGQGRSRPWRLVSRRMRLPDVFDDPETVLAADEFARMWRERALGRYRAWNETKRAYPRQWQEAAMESELVTYLTAEEMDQLGHEVHELIAARFAERQADASTRPADSAAVEILMFGYPLAPPSAPEKKGQTP